MDMILFAFGIVLLIVFIAGIISLIIERNKKNKRVLDKYHTVILAGELDNTDTQINIVVKYLELTNSYANRS